MHVSQLQEQITIKISNKEDFNKITDMQLDLMLPRRKQKVNKQYNMSKTEPLLVFELPAKVQAIMPLKEATVKVNSITVTLIKQKTLV